MGDEKVVRFQISKPKSDVVSWKMVTKGTKKRKKIKKLVDERDN